MLVILIDNQRVKPETVCQTCPMASQKGEPRWQQGRLRCGRPVASKLAEGPAQYECTMGFRVTELVD
ncbi:MAG: hypothetical protein AAF810_14415 [Cyanobacteria bacterium P01_D01_bin.36]